MHGKSTRLPPRPPPGAHPLDAQLSRPFAVSAIIHGGLITFMVIKSLLGFDRPKPYIPTLRVDLVGLPDQLKSQKSVTPPGGGAQNEVSDTTEKLQKAAQNADKIKSHQVQKPLPDEMTLKNKKKQKTPPPPPSTSSNSKKNDRARENKIKNALSRIKALNKIQADSPGDGALIKGNQLSAGTSLSGDAREGDAANYYDILKDHLQSHWELPIWLSRKNLSARVILYIDRRGQVMRLEYTQKSGNAQFDEAVRRAIVASEPFPVPSAEAAKLGAEGVTIHFPL